MERIPEIKTIFILTKKDCTDFDRSEISKQLGIKPTKSEEPMLSKGIIVSENDIVEAQKELSGLTPVKSDTEEKYNIIKHAFWSVDLPKIKCLSLEEPLQEMLRLLKNKENIVRNLCHKYNLKADLIFCVYANANEMPLIEIPVSDNIFLASMGVNISFDFYLD